jgi:hypothetical protein
MRPTTRAYSHQGHGPRADQVGRIHISDIRYLAKISIAFRSRSIHSSAKPTIQTLVMSSEAGHDRALALGDEIAKDIA